MKIIKAPNIFDAENETRKSVFLCGSIEMGKAIDWQKDITEALENIDCIVLNPRRDDWDSSWEQSIDNPNFKGQVDWELSSLENSDVIAVYFQPGTQSPISLLELGFFASAAPEKMIVCCPEGFWRKGNVDIVCDRYGVEQVQDLIGLTKSVVNRLKNDSYTFKYIKKTYESNNGRAK